MSATLGVRVKFQAKLDVLLGRLKDRPAFRYIPVTPESISGQIIFENPDGAEWEFECSLPCIMQ
ncbi:hypothetical protein BDZ89DRAFT_1071267 [Hymenopellis radicata]|nr:hypothetical protein BDZ89DRAFT_1071267 [Hymenopellis radicata]